MRQLVYTMLITNNHDSFHFWWHENFVKHQNVSQYYDQDCSAFTVLSDKFRFDCIHPDTIRKRKVFSRIKSNWIAQIHSKLKQKWRWSATFWNYVAVTISNSFMTNEPHHIETSQFICIVNQLTGFCMMGNTGR